MIKADFYGYCSRGGAGIAMMRTVAGLRAKGVDVNLYTADSFASAPTRSAASRVVSLIKWRLFWARRKRCLSGREPHYEQFSLPFLPYPTPVRRCGADVIHLHWIASMLDYRSFFKSIPEGTPVVWTLHDMNPFTGGCHYSWDCDGFASVCRGCPQLGGASRRHLAEKVQNVKKASLKGLDLHVVADSHWIEAEARRSSVFEEARSFRTIHYGLDVEIFRPFPKGRAKNAFGVDQDVFTVVFGSDLLSSRRKGGQVLVDAVNLLWSEGAALEVIAFGSPADYETLRPIHYAGMVESEADLVRIYSSGDVFVIPSLHEAFGQTALESMACGVPTIGFRTGGIPDMIEHGETGFLVESVGDPRNLAATIRLAMEKKDMLQEMGERGRQRVLDYFTLERQASEYLQLYEDALEGDT